MRISFTHIDTLALLALVNALNACATVVEALVDVDSKFVKLADKECDSLSADVKKWFKVLAVSAAAYYHPDLSVILPLHHTPERRAHPRRQTVSCER